MAIAEVAYKFSKSANDGSRDAAQKWFTSRTLFPCPVLNPVGSPGAQHPRRKMALKAKMGASTRMATRSSRSVRMAVAAPHCSSSASLRSVQPFQVVSCQ